MLVVTRDCGPTVCKQRAGAYRVSSSQECWEMNDAEFHSVKVEMAAERG